MGKLSNLPADSSPVLADWLIGIQNSSTTDVKMTMAGLIAFLAANLPQSSTIPYKASVYRNAALSSSGGIITFDTEVYDTSSNYSVSTGKFTVTAAGFYRVHGVLSVLPDSSAHYFATTVYKNGTAVKRGNQLSGTTNALAPGISCDVQCAIGDYLQVGLETNGSSIALNTGGPTDLLTWADFAFLSTT